MRLIDADALRFPAMKGSFNEIDLSRMDGYSKAIQIIRNAPTIDAAPVVHARWEWFEEWSPSTQEHFAECDEYGWRCGRCKTALEDMVGGYWDDSSKEPELNFCPNCGVKMYGE